MTHKDQMFKSDGNYQITFITVLYKQASQFNKKIKEETIYIYDALLLGYDEEKKKVIDEFNEKVKKIKSTHTAFQASAEIIKERRKLPFENPFAHCFIQNGIEITNEIIPEDGKVIRYTKNSFTKGKLLNDLWMQGYRTLKEIALQEDKRNKIMSLVSKKAEERKAKFAENK